VLAPWSEARLIPARYLPAQEQPWPQKQTRSTSTSRARMTRTPSRRPYHVLVAERLAWFETADALPRYERGRAAGPPIRHGPRQS